MQLSQHLASADASVRACMMYAQLHFRGRPRALKGCRGPALVVVVAETP